MASGRTDAPVATDARPKRRRLPGVAVRPGSVKQARLDSGLSLAQLGRGHVTAPAIYLIEVGRTRPSLPTLEHIARRTGKPVEFFLAEPAGAADGTQANLIALEVMVADVMSYAVETLRADHVVIRTHGVANDALYHALLGRLPDVRRVGDAIVPRLAAWA